MDSNEKKILIAVVAVAVIIWILKRKPVGLPAANRPYTAPPQYPAQAAAQQPQANQDAQVAAAAIAAAGSVAGGVLGALGNAGVFSGGGNGGGTVDTSFEGGNNTYVTEDYGTTIDSSY